MVFKKKQQLKAFSFKKFSRFFFRDGKSQVALKLVKTSFLEFVRQIKKLRKEKHVEILKKIGLSFKHAQSPLFLVLRHIRKRAKLVPTGLTKDRQKKKSVFGFCKSCKANKATFK